MLVTQLSTTTSRVFLDVGIDLRVLGFTAAVAVGTAILFGTVPALRAARIAPIEAMKEQGRGTSSGRRVGLAGSLVMAQVALSLVLLVGAGLFVRTFASLTGVNPGFERDRALLVRIDAHRAAVDSAARGAMYERIQQAVQTLPGVTDAAISMISPVSGSNATRLMDFPGRPELPESDRRIWVNYITPGWFRTLGTTMIAGRDFSDRDRSGAPRAVIVNQAFVARHYATENPLGHIIRETAASYADSTPLEIVGVVGDAVYRSLKEPVPPTMYWPLAQRKRPPSDVTLIVRAAAGLPMSLTKSVAAAVTGVNRDLSLSFRPLSDQVDASIAQERLVARLSGFFGVLALLLAALGLYGITAYAVSRRQIELGIRMALGTSPVGVVRLVLARTGLIVVGGLAVGAMVSWWATKFVGSMLYGLPPRDPATMLGAIAVLAVIGLVAALLPALRAARIDPSQLLRDSG
jgi:predicted permease